MKSSFKGWNDGIVSKSKEVINTDLGDKFIVEFEELNFPDIETSITIKDSVGEVITYFVIHSAIEGELKKDDFKIILNTSEIRCYQYYNELIFRLDNSEFKGVNIEDELGINKDSKVTKEMVESFLRNYIINKDRSS